MTRIRLPIDVRSVAAARGLLHETLCPDGRGTQPGSWGDALPTAALIVSELVTNAILHTHHLLLLEITVTIPARPSPV